MEPLGVHHVSVNVDDVEAALAFYVGDLGLALRGDRPDFPFGGAWLDAGGQQVHLIEAEVPANMGQHFALVVDDLHKVRAELQGKGHAVSRPVVSGTSLQANVHDPAGNCVELHQPHFLAE